MDADRDTPEPGQFVPNLGPRYEPGQSGKPTKIERLEVRVAKRQARLDAAQRKLDTARAKKGQQ